MKFAHVNIVTLPGHSADVNVLLEGELGPAWSDRIALR